MSRSFDSANPTRPLSVGDIVSVALALYRAHLKQYLGIALRAIAWLLLPILGLALIVGLAVLAASGQTNPTNLLGLLLLLIPAVIALFFYCGAKSQMNWAIISWLAYHNLIQQPETTQVGRRLLAPRFWRFFWASLLVTLLLSVVNFGLSVVQQVALVSISAILGSESVLTGLLLGTIALITTAIYAWFTARWALPELPIAVENITAANSVTRSWDLTKGQAVRVLTALFIALLVTLPLYALAFLPLLLSLLATAASFSNGDTSAVIAVMAAFLLSMLLLLSMSLLVTPFWQTLKAVLYYDLRNRREGLDLKLHSRREATPEDTAPEDAGLEDAGFDP